MGIRFRGSSWRRLGARPRRGGLRREKRERRAERLAARPAGEDVGVGPRGGIEELAEDHALLLKARRKF